MTGFPGPMTKISPSDSRITVGITRRVPQGPRTIWGRVMSLGLQNGHLTLFN